MVVKHKRPIPKKRGFPNVEKIYIVEDRSSKYFTFGNMLSLGALIIAVIGFYFAYNKDYRDVIRAKLIIHNAEELVDSNEFQDYSIGIMISNSGNKTLSIVRAVSFATGVDVGVPKMELLQRNMFDKVEDREIKAGAIKDLEIKARLSKNLILGGVIKEMNLKTPYNSVKLPTKIQVILYTSEGKYLIATSKNLDITYLHGKKFKIDKDTNTVEFEELKEPLMDKIY